MTGVELRPARPDEAEALSELAFAAKAHWPYDAAFLEAVRDELTFSPDEVVRRRFVVAEIDGEPAGFYNIDGEPPELANMWISPSRIGTGLGRVLWRHAMTAAAEAGIEQLHIDAEPFAEGFYLKMGAVRVGESPSGSIPGRVLPLLRVTPRDQLTS